MLSNERCVCEGGKKISSFVLSSPLNEMVHSTQIAYEPSNTHEVEMIFFSEITDGLRKVDMVV